MSFYATHNDYYLTAENDVVRIVSDPDCYMSFSDFRDDPFGKICSDSSMVPNETKYGSFEKCLRHYGVKKSGNDLDACERDITSVQQKASEKGDLVLPLSVYIHGAEEFFPRFPWEHFDGKWDCSFLGVVIADKKSIKAKFGEISPETFSKATEIIESELRDLTDAWNGEIYGIDIYDLTGAIIDSSSGYFGSDIETNGMLDYLPEPLKDLGNFYDVEDAIEAAKTYIQNNNEVSR